MSSDGRQRSHSSLTQGHTSDPGSGSLVEMEPGNSHLVIFICGVLLTASIPHLIRIPSRPID